VGTSLYEAIDEWFDSEFSSNLIPTEETPPDRIRVWLDDLALVRDHFHSSTYRSEDFLGVEEDIRAFENYEPDPQELLLRCGRGSDSDEPPEPIDLPMTTGRTAWTHEEAEAEIAHLFEELA
jgi:hypothetical protein